MKPSLLRLLLLALLAISALVLVSAAPGAVLKNKSTGEVIKGTLLPQKVNGQNIFKFEDGKTRYVKPEEWDVIEVDAAPPPPDPVKTGTGTVEKTMTAAVSRAYIIPISGAIELQPLIEEVDKALADAKKLRASVVVFHMNTPGGRLDITDKIIKLIEKVDWAPVVAWVQGEDKESLSAGAYICFSTQKVFMAQGCTLGAATPYSYSVFGSPQVQEKFLSAFRAKFRSLAQTRGYPSAIVDAMVDARTSVVEITLDGQTQVVSADEAARLQQEHQKDGKFKMGKTINRSGQLITLTTDEAVEFKVASGVANSQEDLLKLLGLEGAAVTEAKDLTARVTKIAKDRKKQLDDLKAAYMKSRAQASAFDPEMLSTTSPARTKEYALKAMGYLQECGKVVSKLEELAKDEKYDLDLDPDDLSYMKAKLEAEFARMKAYAGM